MLKDKFLLWHRRAKRYLMANKYDKFIKAVREMSKYVREDCCALGLDFDGTITQNPDLFRLLSMVWPGNIIIVTLRDDDKKLRDLLKAYDIRYDKIVSVQQLDKSQAIIDNDVKLFIEDQDECLQNIPDHVLVLKIRNGGNFVDGKWLYSDATGVNPWAR